MQYKKLFKKILLTLLTILMSQQVYAAGADDFIITVDTNNTSVGSTSNTEFQIPINNGGGGALAFHYNVDCEDDGTFEVNDFGGSYTCVYGSPGTYTIRIEDKIGDGSGFIGLGFNFLGDRQKLLSVEQWGTFQWKFMDNAFKGCFNVVFNAIDTPNFSSVTDMSAMFAFAVQANPNTTNWAVHNVTTMAGMFSSAQSANPDTSNWNTSSVTNMEYMFENAFMVNPDVHNWVVSQVTNMEGMFLNVTLPTTDYDKLLINFNAQNVQSSILFGGGNSKYCATGAHNSLELNDSWTIVDGGQEIPSNCPNPADDFVMTIKTDNLSIGSTGSTSIKIPTIGSGYNYSVDWDSDGTYDQAGITGDATHDYLTTGTYSIRIRGDFPRIYFNYTGDILKIKDVVQWGNNPWTSMENAFAGAENMTVTANFAPNLSNLTSLQSMFSGALLANPVTTFWDVSNVTDMSFMFQEATSANPNVQNWDISNMISMDGMFEGVTLPTLDYDEMIIHFDSFSVTQILFDGGDSQYCSRAAQLAHDHLDGTWNITDGGLDPSCSTLADDFVIKVDTAIVGSTSNTQFEINTTGSGYNYNVDCDGANPSTNTATAQIGNYTCNYAIPGVYTIRISDNIGDKTGFPRIHGFGNLDMHKIINLKQWGTGVWSSMSVAFVNSSNMVVTATDVPDFSNVTSLSSMFAGASLANPNVSNWNTSNIQNMEYMFQQAILAKPNMSSWDISSVTVPHSMDLMLSGVTLPMALYDATLANFNSQVTANGIVFDGGNSSYCNISARDSLINTHGWSITDGGLDANCPTVSEDIFSNGFEDVIIFKAAQSQFNYDFSEVSVNDLDEQPLLIAQGVDDKHKPVIQIYLRNDVGQLQIRLDKLDLHHIENIQWIQGQWQSIDNKELTTISW